MEGFSSAPRQVYYRFDYFLNIPHQRYGKPQEFAMPTPPKSGFLGIPALLGELFNFQGTNYSFD